MKITLALFATLFSIARMSLTLPILVPELESFKAPDQAMPQHPREILDSLNNREVKAPDTANDTLGPVPDGHNSAKPSGFNDRKGLLQVGLLEASGQGLICLDLLGEDCDVEHFYPVSHNHGNGHESRAAA